jgi:hypothetical protein
MAPHKAIAHVSHVPEEYVLEELELKDMWTVQDYARVNNYEFVHSLHATAWSHLHHSRCGVINSL